MILWHVITLVRLFKCDKISLRIIGLVGLVSLFNGISTLFRLFNAKAILLEEQYYSTHSWEDKGVHTFPKGICSKVNVIARLEYELAYYDSAVHRYNHYTMRTPPFKNYSWPTVVRVTQRPFFNSYYTNELERVLLLSLTLHLYLLMLSVKQGSIKYHFLSLWYDSTWD